MIDRGHMQGIEIEGYSDSPVRIVVPCYNEADRFECAAVVNFIESTADIGLVLVNDGSRDNTLFALRTVANACPGRVVVVNCLENGGKAEAVRLGVLAALAGASRPRFVGYWDADLATPLPVIRDFQRTAEKLPAVDIVIGARVALLGRAIERKPLRHYLGRVFATGASFCLNLPVYDTQCGAKLIRVNDRTASCFERPFMSRWIFDVELIARYLASGGTKQGLYEETVPEWHDVEGSKVRPIDFVRGVRELAAIYRRYDLHQPMRSVLLPVFSGFTLYALVGMCGTLVHYAVLLSLVELADVNPVPATAIGATLGAATNYALNYYFTFDSYKRHGWTFAKFLSVTGVGIALSTLGLYLAASLGLPYVPAQVVCTLLILLVGFAANKHWTFAPAIVVTGAEKPGVASLATPADSMPPSDVERSAPYTAPSRIAASGNANVDR